MSKNSGTSSEGHVKDAQLAKQLKVLNEDFASTGICFVHGNTTRHVNADWFSSAGPGTREQTEMKRALRKGNAMTLNVYTVGFKSVSIAGLLGYSTFPSSYAKKPHEDGIVLHCESLPGGSLQAYNLGRTLSHEAGHFFGLYHTSTGGCVDGTSGGDYVSDTPAEESPATGCSIGRDTCSSSGLDPVTSFMDYSDDSCMDSFTPGQANRMMQQVMAFRA
ncbi:hypothetical protein C8J56DRAFT_173843 [Mycena floridula]|nr:hypothetical protein C8J56DRAFT_173843 [Mycena floridula]